MAVTRNQPCARVLGKDGQHDQTMRSRLVGNSFFDSPTTRRNARTALLGGQPKIHRERLVEKSSQLLYVPKWDSRSDSSKHDPVDVLCSCGGDVFQTSCP